MRVARDGTPVASRGFSLDDFGAALVTHVGAAHIGYPSDARF